VPAYLVASRRADVSLVRKFTRTFVSCCFSHGVPKRGGNDDDMDIDLDDDTGDSRGGKKRSVVVKKPARGGKKGGSRLLLSTLWRPSLY
jgi:hypothetical protein